MFSIETETAVYCVLMIDDNCTPVGFAETHPLTASKAADETRGLINTLGEPVFALLFKANGTDVLNAGAQHDLAALNAAYAGAVANDAAITKHGVGEFSPRLSAVLERVLGPRRANVVH